MNLDLYGDGCRCLLRLRENSGREMMDDNVFIKQRLESYPDWKERPGQAKLERLLEIATELGVGCGGHVKSDYEEVLSDHDAGRSILVQYQRAKSAGGSDRDDQIGLLVQMDQTGLRLWVPEVNGSSDVVSLVRRDFWARTAATAIVLNESRSPILSSR